MSTRIGIGIGIGLGSAPSTPSALTYVTSGVLQYVRADLGITLNGSNVSAWADQSGAAKDYSQGTGAAQPAYSTTSGPNNTAGVTFDGADDLLTSALDLAAPGTTPTTIWMIVKAVTWTNNDTFVSASSANAIQVFQQGVTPAVTQTNANNSNTNLTVGTWRRLEAFFNNNTTDFLRIGATNVTGASSLNASGTGRVLGGRAAANFANIVVSELMYVNRELTAGERTNLDAYVTTRYGAGLT